MNFFATCGRGLEPILARELTALGASEVAPGRGGCSFAGNLETLYRANLWLRTAVRILRPVLEAEVITPDDLYEACRTILWSNYLTPRHTIAVDSNVRDSAITHSQYAARRVKDAICDQFRDRQGVRPSVDPERPMVGLNLHIARNRMVLSLDSSWDSLHKRGYRPVQTRAPLNEALAAGMLLHLGYDGTTPLVDPLCGSGTFAIEAAMIACDRPPGLTREWFGFQGWPDFDRPLWSAMLYDARRSAKPKPAAPIVGRDAHAGAVAMATENARAAGLGTAIEISACEWEKSIPPTATPGLIVCNPPYGERLGDESQWVGLYRSLGSRFASHWPGWRLAVFTANERLASEIGLPPTRSTPFYNGALACRLLEYGPGAIGF